VAAAPDGPMTRAGRDKWLQEGIEVLSKSGEAAVTIELLAARLGVNRGSFAFHFGDLPAFMTALVEHWAERAIDGDSARIFAGDPRVDRSMRAWGARDPAVQLIVRRVDEARLAKLTAIHRASGKSEPERRAFFEHAAFVGASWLLDDLGSPQAQALADDLIRALEALP